MKIYLFYIKLKNLEPYLYAYTNNKEYYRKFKKERNEDIFIIREKDINKENYYDFAKKHSNINLKECMFETYIDEGDEYKRDIVRLICTYNEESSVILNFDMVSKEISKSTNRIAVAFNYEIKKALDDLYYFDFLKQKVDREINMYNATYGASYEYLDYLEDINESPIGYNYDYLAIFIKMYGYTLKK